MGSAGRDPIVIKGNHFYYETDDTEFIVRGVGYWDFGANTTRDLLADPNHCGQDADGLAKLPGNVVIAAGIDTSQNHSLCMGGFAAQGIYVIVYLPAAPAAMSNELLDSPLWNTDLYLYYTTLIDQFASYTNILGFVLPVLDIGVLSASRGQLAFTKAAARDLQAYLKKSTYRKVPIGGWIAPKSIEFATDYLTCGDSTSGLFDFWIIDGGDVTCQANLTASDSSLNQLSLHYENSTRPLILKGDECFVRGNFSFNWVSTVFGAQLASIWSGAYLYDWLEQGRDDISHGSPSCPLGSCLGYGLVNHTVDDAGNEVMAFFVNAYGALQKNLSSLPAPTTIKYDSRLPVSTTVPTCPKVTGSLAISTNLPPSPNIELCDCMMQSLGCAVPQTLPNNDTMNLMSDLCNKNSTFCIGTQADGTNGVYGAFSVCSLYQQISWSLNMFAVHQIAQDNSTTCNYTTWGKTQVATVGETCSPMLDAAGVLGQNVVVASSVPTSTSSSRATPSHGPDSEDTHVVSPGGIAGIAISGLVVVSILIGVVVLSYRRYIKPSTKHKLDPSGLEVGSPASTAHGLTSGSEPRLSEMWTKMNTPELAGTNASHEKEAVHSPVAANGKYVAVDTGLPGTPEMRSSREERESLTLQFSSSWGGAEWFDPNDARQVLR